MSLCSVVFILSGHDLDAAGVIDPKLTELGCVSATIVSSLVARRHRRYKNRRAEGVGVGIVCGANTCSDQSGQVRSKRRRPPLRRCTLEKHEYANLLNFLAWSRLLWKIGRLTNSPYRKLHCFVRETAFGLRVWHLSRSISTVMNVIVHQDHNISRPQWRIQRGPIQANPAMPPPLQSGHGIHCGQLILREISKIGGTRCQILSRSVELTR